MISSSILDHIGQTPLVRVPMEDDGARAQIWAKLDHLGPGGSAKDRVCVAMLEDAEARGLVVRPGPIVAPTSGNSGVAMAMVCAAKGYRCVLTMPEGLSVERRQLIEACGAEIVVTPAAVGMKGAHARALEIVEATRGAHLLNATVGRAVLSTEP